MKSKFLLYANAVTLTRRAKVSIPQMRDERSARSVQSALKFVGGVQSVGISLDKSEAHVRFDPEKVDPRQLGVAVHALGYEGIVID